ncbi:MAG TPA: hypothetical protein VJA27_01670 [Patescibacteria group bacterium]|nr:hypothetical protein [Patescibacteria group bacterium]
MKSSQLNQVLRLIRRTGDRAIIMDPAGEEVVVLMNLNDYEALLDQTDDSLAYAEPDHDLLADEPSPWGTMEAEIRPDWHEDEGSNWRAPSDFSTFSELATKRAAPRFQPAYPPQPDDSQLDFSAGWNEQAQNIPSSMEEEVSLEDVPSEEEEEKFYLEPIDET